MNRETVMEQLEREAGYAQRSRSRDLLIETYGKAKMARQLEVITHQEFMKINHMTVHFINTHTNVAAVMKSSKESVKGFRGEVEKAKKELKKYDEQKLKEKEIRIKNTAAYKAIQGVKEKLEPVSKKVIQLKAKEEAAVSKIKHVARELGKVKDSKVIKFAAEGTEKVLKGIGKAAVVGTAAAFTAVTVASAGAVKSAVEYQNQMQGFLSPSNEMAKTLKQLGYESGAAALEQEGLDGILKKLKASVNGDEVAFANLFSSVEAKNAVLALAGNQAENFSTKTAAMVTASGAADAAFKTQTASVSEMMGKVKNAGSVMLTSLGEKALPYITAGLEKLIDRLPEMEKAFDKVAERAGPILETVAGAVQNAYQTCRPIVEQFGATFMAAFVAAKPAINTVVSSVQSMLPYIQPVLESVVGVVSSAIPVVADIFAGLSAVAAAVFPVVSEIIGDVGTKISGIFSGISGETGTLRSAFETAGPVIANVLQTMWAVAGPILDVVISTVKLVASAYSSRSLAR